ncbi:MAG: cbb3-type cytochrome c oxidase subunit I [Verrucomicrobiota bacterium]|jgi:cytochrome c oxidase cbb3-type subunit 1
MSDHTLPPHHVDSGHEPFDSKAIDASVRLPVIILFGNAIHWLVIGSLLSLIVSVKLIAPGFLGGVSFMTYGRLAPMARDLMLYGWASQAALGAGIWLMARLCGRPLGGEYSGGFGGSLLRTLIISATVLWNLAVLLGTLAILAGYSSGVEWLEYPNWASAMLLLSFLLIGIWAVLLFDRRSTGRAEVAQWYLVAAFCWFPWVYGTANLLLVWKPIQASAQGPIQSWYCGSLLALWLLPVALAGAYALLPRLLGSHLNRRHLATLGFWMLLFLGGWNGMDRLIGGPVPAWMTSAGVVAGVLFLIPIFMVSMNLFGMSRNKTVVEASYPIRFLLMGLYALVIVGVIGALASLPDVSGAVRFTAFTEAKTQLWILGAISLPLFAVLYESLPQLLGRECWSPELTGRHYTLTLVGIAMLVILMLLGGLFTGIALADPTVSFLNITSYSYPFHLMECVAQLLLLIAVLTLGANITRALAGDYLLNKHNGK